jgi:DNA-binding beta-propeller fold protein YncE
VYVDDIEILSLVSNPNPLPEPYTVTFHADRFTNASIIKVAGPVGDVAVDPRDNTTILFALDVAPPAGGIYRTRKVADGNWAVDAQPVVAGLDRPSGLAIAEDGTIWWTHDYTMSLMRLRAPWDSNVPEQVIANFGTAATDDDPIDVTIAPASFGGVLANANMVIVADRGSDGDANNAVYFVDPATTELNQAMYDRFLVLPSATTLGTANLNAIAPLPQTGEVVTLSEDGYIVAVDGSGATRRIVPDTLYVDPLLGILPSAVAVDPTSGRIWVADDSLDEVWSVGFELDPFDRLPDRQELSFPLTNPSRPDRQIDIHDPGMAFAPDGSILVLADTSTADGTGRLLVFHNEVFTIPEYRASQVVSDEEGVHLQWEPAGNVTFQVQRRDGLDPETPFEDISGDLKVTHFTDTNAPPGQAFYRIVAKPQ